MKKVLRSFLAMIILMAMGTSVYAQDDIEATVSADVVSNYIWRGAKADDAALQPTLGIAYKGLSLSAWGSYGMTGKPSTTEELDLTLGYAIGNFNVGVTDYWINGDKYFHYDANTTAHVFEANLGYDFGKFSVQWYTNFAGADSRNSKGDRSYSSYIEFAAPFSLGGLDWEATVGMVPFAAKDGFYDVNTDGGFAVNNVALKACKELKISDTFSLPVFAQFAANPSTQKAFLVLGFTVNP